MTNFDKIKKMSMDEIAMAIMCPYELLEFKVKPCTVASISSCYKCILNWLEHEAEE